MTAFLTPRALFHHIRKKPIDLRTRPTLLIRTAHTDARFRTTRRALHPAHLGKHTIQEITNIPLSNKAETLTSQNAMNNEWHSYVRTP